MRMVLGALACGLVLATAAKADPSFDLKVTVLGAKPHTGQILTALFNSSRSYMKTPLRKQTSTVNGAGASTIVFAALPAAHYAISVIYDKNGDGELNTNFIGIPIEAFGFSNNATALFGPPDWPAARFALGGDLKVEIKLEDANR